MVLCYEEKDRTAIEAVGMKIIEFKRMIYKLSGIFQKVFRTIRKVVDMIVDAVKKGLQSITRIEPRKRWKIVKSSIPSNIPSSMFFPRWKVYHCRNNC